MSVFVINSFVSLIPLFFSRLKIEVCQLLGNMQTILSSYLIFIQIDNATTLLLLKYFKLFIHIWHAVITSQNQKKKKSCLRQSSSKYCHRLFSIQINSLFFLIIFPPQSFLLLISSFMISNLALASALNSCMFCGL